MLCVLSLSKTRSITVRGDQARYMGISGRFIDGYDFPLESSPHIPGFIKGPSYCVCDMDGMRLLHVFAHSAEIIT